MKKIISLLTLAFCMSVSLVFAQSNGVGTNDQFHGPVGLQMYSLRSIAQNDVEAAIKLAAEMGFKYVEASSFYDLTAEQYKALLDKYGLIAADIVKDLRQRRFLLDIFPEYRYIFY